MARTNAVNFSGGLQFPYATSATDIFKKEDVQTLAQAVDQHDHTTGKGHSINTVPANASITNAMLGSDVARANLLTNPSFEIWQRGPGPFTAPSGWAADRWSGFVQASDSMSVSRDTANADAGSTACAAITFTRGGSSPTSGLAQQLGLTDNPSLVGRVLTFSVRVKTSVAGAVKASIYNGTAWADSPVYSGGGAYQTLSVTTPSPVVATAYVYVLVNFAASCTAYIDNAMLVVGSQPSDYAPLHPADDLARCLRYYEVIQPMPGLGFCTAQAYSATDALGVLSFRVQKAVAPTVSFSAPTNNFTLRNAAGTQLGCTALANHGANQIMMQIDGTVASGLVAGNASLLCGAAGQSPTVILEANP